MADQTDQQKKNADEQKKQEEQSGVTGVGKDTGKKYPNDPKK